MQKSRPESASRDSSLPPYDASRHYAPKYNGHIEFVDMAKCLMLVAVVVSHSEANFMADCVDPFIIPLFWVCSGYTSRSDFSLRKRLSVIWAYFIMTAVCMTVCSIFPILCQYASLNATDVWGALYARDTLYAAPPSASNPVLLRMCNNPLWFLPSLFSTYCLFRVVMTTRLLLAQIFLCSVSLFIGTLLTLSPYLLPWSVDLAFVSVIFMCFGHWVRRYSLIEKMTASGVVACIVFYTCMWGYTGLINPSVRDYGAHWPSMILTGCVGSLALLLLCRYAARGWVGRLSVIIDKGALMIFGLHLLFVETSKQLCSGVVGDWKLRVLITIAMSFVGGWLVWKAWSLLTSGVRRLYTMAFTR